MSITALEGNALFFTSQMDATLDRNFTSCSTGRIVPREVFLIDEPDNAERGEACVALNLDKANAGLQDVKCGKSNNVLCEVIHVFCTSFN